MDVLSEAERGESKAAASATSGWLRGNGMVARFLVAASLAAAAWAPIRLHYTATASPCRVAALPVSGKETLGQRAIEQGSHQSRRRVSEVRRWGGRG